ncbi:type II toxin-antitoxin system RelB/DinJ family antitoxin [Pediococcus pentosaceus]|uniref:type II toxin-antitoxin system RelB/DinJ family antitoxin n=1 Tax=Pediococcus pentosaceus TaxID=1255 RepID=UPI003D32D638
MATSATTIRLDNELKEKLTKELSTTVLSINAYFNMAARQLILQKMIPFEVLIETDEPTEETRRALVAAEAKELGSFQMMSQNLIIHNKGSSMSQISQ